VPEQESPVAGAAGYQQVAHHLKSVVGLNTWGTRLRVGSGFAVEFGTEDVDLFGSDPSRFRLAVYCASWRIESPTEVLAFCEEKRPSLQQKLLSLNHTRLVSMDIDSRSFSANFTFDNGLSLILFSIFREEYEHWKMFCPGGKVFVAGPGAEYDWRNSG
jgi:hypothetical protein